jgi:hypothetical protein
MAEASTAPVRSGDRKTHPAEHFALLNEFESELERFWRRPWFGHWQSLLPSSFPALAPEAKS